MKVFVTAKPGSKTTGIKQIKGLFDKDDNTHLIVSVKEPPTEGRANRAIEKAIAEHFNLPLSRVRITSELLSRKKIIEIRD